MPYAIYSLSIGGVEQTDFTSYSKTRPEVLADVVKYLLSLLSKPNTSNLEVASERLQADLYLDSSYVAGILEDIDLKVIQVIDEPTAKKIDVMFDLVGRAQGLMAEFNRSGNRPAEIRLAQIDFGVKRCLNRRFSRYYLDYTSAQCRQEASVFDQYFHQASAFGFFLKSEYSDERFDQMVNSLMQ